MSWKWFPWKYLLSLTARRHGFLDPIKLLSQLQNFTRPSEVAVPTELLRSGVILHARGLVNSLAIQHNLDWIWPYWVDRQYNPRDPAFIPRSFSLTQINLTHRNWTALGIPDDEEFPLVDPAGLVTPHYDGWSIDFWVIPEKGLPLIPSRLKQINQKIMPADNLVVVTESSLGGLKLKLEAQVIGGCQEMVCLVKAEALSAEKARLVVSLRPYNPEGVSFINQISLLKDVPGWMVNKDKNVFLDKQPQRYVFSDYNTGDVYSRLSNVTGEEAVSCKVGLASAAAIYELEPAKPLAISVAAPLKGNKIDWECFGQYEEAARQSWRKSLIGASHLEIPDAHFKFLYENAVRTMVLHSANEIFPGPYIYRKFWFRDAAFIVYGLLSCGLFDRAKKALDSFRHRQTLQGYFLSQEGEWDSNGQVLWVMGQYCRLTGNPLPEEWRKPVIKGARWIIKKLLPASGPCPHAGLLPSGFSAEHLGPNDFYYWDDFWAVAGLKEAAFLCEKYGETQNASLFEDQARLLQENIERSLEITKARLARPAMPASVYRRLDSGSIGSLVASYPLRIFEKNDPRITDTVDFLLKNCLVEGGFFHDMTHSGINPYLSLDLAQALLRSGDSRFWGLVATVARLASPTGQWPESIHPQTFGGCMGDGEHVWASAEWVLMVRNLFVREEAGGLILCSGVPEAWLKKNQLISFGPAPTAFGPVKISLRPVGSGIEVEWFGQWRSGQPAIQVALPGFTGVQAGPLDNKVILSPVGNP